MKSFEAKIFIGFKERDTGRVHPLEYCKIICQNFVNAVSQCVTVTPTEFIYKNGCEPGAIIGFIQYPRFPEEESYIKQLSIDLAELLMDKLFQYRVTINLPDEVIMLSNPKLVKE